MANYGTATTTTTQRPSTNPPLPPLSKNGGESKDWSRKKLSTLAFSFPFDIPASPESGAIRIVRNLENYSLYYATFIWTVLFIALVPDHRDESVIFLVATTEVAFIYSLLLRAYPDSFVLNSIVDKRFVFFVLFVVGAIGMIATDAEVHLFIVLASTIPVVILHAALSKREAAVGEADEEMARLVEEKLGGGGGGGAQPENLV